MAVAMVKALFVGPDGRVPPQELVDATGYEVVPPEIPESIRRWEDAEDDLLEQRELATRDG